jgi:hypothetical protein
MAADHVVRLWPGESWVRLGVPSGVVVHEEAEGLVGLAAAAQFGDVLVAQLFKQRHLALEAIRHEVPLAVAIGSLLATFL